MIKTKTWVLIFGILFSLALATVLLMYCAPRKNPVARIYVDGICLNEIDLNSAENGSYLIETEYGSNTVTIAAHKVCVSEADCPCHTCVKTGWISDGTMPIVCLPHHLTVKIESAKISADAVTR